MRNLFLMCALPLLLVAFFIDQGELFIDSSNPQEESLSQRNLSSSQYTLVESKYSPNSLKLTNIDGQLEVDSDGNLIVSEQVKKVFDYFLMTLGEESLDEILIRINAHLTSKLAEPALSQAKKVLAQYLDYKNNMVVLSESYNDQAEFLGGEFETLQAQLDMQSRLRRESMDPEVVQAFFEFDEVYDQWSLDRLKIGADDSLSINERKQLLAQMEKQLPEEILKLQESKYQPQELRELQRAQSFASEEEKYTFYQQQLGDEAAQRLQQLDSNRQQWQARLDDYFERKNELLSVEGLDQMDMDVAVTDLKKSLFSDNEQRRLIALESMKSTAAH